MDEVFNWKQFWIGLIKLLGVWALLCIFGSIQYAIQVATNGG